MDSYDLSPFGWDACTIPTNLREVFKHLPSWTDLKVLRNAQTLSGYAVYFPYKFFTNQSELYMPGIIKGDTEDDGGYAQIYKGRRAIFKSETGATSGSVHLAKVTPFTEICIKEVRLNITPEEDAAPPHHRRKYYEDEIKAILYEAFLHALLYKTLEREGFPSAVPRMYEVLATTTNNQYNPASPCDYETVWITMEFINGLTLEKFLKRKLLSVRQGGNATANESMLIDIFIQLAFYLHILQTKVRFNHRDLKINNVFVRHHNDSEHWSQSLTIPSIGSWNCKQDIVLIDFGFACIACGSGYPNPRATMVGAGSWFKAEHDCLKYGRDLGQFLYSIHCTFPLQEYVSSAFFDLIHSALYAEKGGRRIDLMYGFQDDGAPQPATGPLPKSVKFNDGIYIFLRDSDVDLPGCEPYKFLSTLAAYIRASSD
jgi:hypothetical protein